MWLISYNTNRQEKMKRTISVTQLHVPAAWLSEWTDIKISLDKTLNNRRATPGESLY